MITAWYAALTPYIQGQLRQLPNYPPENALSSGQPLPPQHLGEVVAVEQGAAGALCGRGSDPAAATAGEHARGTDSDREADSEKALLAAYSDIGVIIEPCSPQLAVGGESTPHRSPAAAVRFTGLTGLAEFWRRWFLCMPDLQVRAREVISRGDCSAVIQWSAEGTHSGASWEWGGLSYGPSGEKIQLSGIALAGFSVTSGRLRDYTHFWDYSEATRIFAEAQLRPQLAPSRDRTVRRVIAAIWNPTFQHSSPQLQDLTAQDAAPTFRDPEQELDQCPSLLHLDSISRKRDPNASSDPVAQGATSDPAAQGGLYALSGVFAEGCPVFDSVFSYPQLVHGRSPSSFSPQDSGSVESGSTESGAAKSGSGKFALPSEDTADYAFRGVAGIIELMAMYRAAFPDAALTHDELHVTAESNDVLAASFYFSGTHLGSLRTLPPSRRRVVVPVVVAFRFDGLQVITMRFRCDFLSIMSPPTEGDAQAAQAAPSDPSSSTLQPALAITPSPTSVIRPASHSDGNHRTSLEASLRAAPTGGAPGAKSRRRRSRDLTGGPLSASPTMTESVADAFIEEGCIRGERERALLLLWRALEGRDESFDWSTLQAAESRRLK